MVLIMSYNGFSQKSNTEQINIPEGKIIYVFVSNYLSSGEIAREAKLIFNEERSKFVHSRGDEPIVLVNGVDYENGFYVQDEIGNVIYKDFTDDSLKIRKIVYLEPYVSGEPIPEMNWNITNTTKEIGSFTARLATTNFRGRNYKAWFTQEIPISDGPWKFSGLPGMILEVVSEKGDYEFLFKGIEMPIQSTSEAIVFDNDGIYLEFEEFVEAEDLEFQKAKKESEAKWLSTGGEPGGFKMTKNPTNPIELTYD